MEYREHFADIVRDYREHISEVFFPWIEMPSGRPPILPDEYMSAREQEDLLTGELRRIRASGAGLDLLLNANCYGAGAVSTALEKRICDIMNRLREEECAPDTVTTASPFAAHVIRKHFPGTEVRASVNMRIGTIQAMKYASDLFDSFYIQRDRQRDIGYVRTVSGWCHENGKKLCMLVNSGCLRFCPGQVFHDNLIAHCQEAEEAADAARDFNPHICWRLYEGKRNAAEILKSTWIRPEDVHNYAGLIDVFKLATRQHSHPRSVIGAYAAEKWDGNLLELLEPGLAAAFYPDMIDNAAFPEDFWLQTGKCRDGCSECGYCEKVLQQVYHKADMS